MMPLFRDMLLDAQALYSKHENQVCTSILAKLVFGRLG